MIRNEAEYKEAVARLVAEAKRMEDYERALAVEGLSPQESARAMEPIRSFHAQLAEEVDSYEKLKRREVDELENLRGLGRLLIGLRIAQGLSQRELAERLGVHESQVSRDERNEYHGITLARAAAILDALEVELRIDFKIKPPVAAA